MNTKLELSVAVLAASLLLPTAQAADQGGVSIPMLAIPGMNYEMGKYEVTQAQLQAVMGSNPSSFSECGDNCPVEQVSWADIQVFLQKLNAKTGKQYRLPSEDEWEYACRGGSSSEYCGGDNLYELGWYNSRGKTHPVGFKKPNGYGLYDMSGNVWEWTSDCWEGYCAQRVVRGGSCVNGPRLARASFRYRIDTAYRFNNLGFRLARTLP